MINYRLREITAKRAAIATPADAGRALGAARIDKDRANRDAKLQQLRNCVASGRIAHLGWPA